MFKAAIIGCGNIAGGYDKKIPDSWSFTHAGAYHLCSDTELVAAADPDGNALNLFSKKWNVRNAYSDYREMFEKEEIDIVSLCLPTANHFDAFKYACEKDVPAIFCEKPLSFDLTEGKEMVKMSWGRVVAVNYFRRWNQAVQQLKEEIKAGRYGKIIHITLRYSKGIMVNGSHLIDLMLSFFGEPEDFDLIKIHNGNTGDPGVDFKLNFKSNVAAYFLHIPDIEYVFIDVDILTEKGRIVLAQRGQLLEKSSCVLEPYYEKFDILRKTEDIETEWKSCLKNAVQEITDCLNNRGRISCTPEDGLRAMELCHKIVNGKK